MARRTPGALRFGLGLGTVIGTLLLAAIAPDDRLTTPTTTEQVTP